MRRTPVALLVALCALVSIGAAAGAATDPWKRLRRPLHLPSLSPGELCPVSDARRRSGVADALGEEPPWAYPFPDSFVILERARPRADGWFAYRIGWVAPARFTGPVLVRGRRLDRSAPVRFAETATAKPSAELRLSFKTSRRAQLRGRSWLLLRSPGCFGFQLDGRTFSTGVVFAARLSA